MQKKIIILILLLVVNTCLIAKQEICGNYRLPQIKVESSDDGIIHKLRINTVLQYEKNDELTKELINREDQIVHLLKIILSSKTYIELNSEKKRDIVTEEIKTHINVILISGKIKDIYFKEFLLN